MTLLRVSSQNNQMIELAEKEYIKGIIQLIHGIYTIHEKTAIETRGHIFNRV